MGYQFDFSDVLAYWPTLLYGVLITLELTLFGTSLGVALGIFCAWGRTNGPRPFRIVVGLYVELIRNTPFLVQLFFIFFGLPALGLELSAIQAAILATVINLGAYSAEIIRAGIEATPKGQIEAGASLGLTNIETFRHVVLKPALARIWPALSAQIVIVMLGTAVCSQISVQELTYAASFIQSRSFRAFEAYFIVTAIYLGLALILRQLLRLCGRILFPAQRHS
ncbi:MAG: polar amino acid ABC transporter permease [Acidocella sp. 35-58-6]|nr:MAG: polar amino acid ABC transporter permease [Acidocella sp. 35-58-6]